MTIYQNYMLMMAYLRDGLAFNLNLPAGCQPCDVAWFEANAIGFASR